MYAASTNRGEQPLETILRPIHQGWIEAARQYLDPAGNPGAEFWTRWAAVRYLNDEFLGGFKWERALVHELRAFLPVDATERLERQGDRIARLRLELDRVGRRRGTGDEVAAIAQELLQQLTLWCAAIEAAARVIPREALTEHGVTLLAHLETAELMRL